MALGVGFTVQSVVDLARTRMNDDARKRASDPKCVSWTNEAMAVMVLLAPQLFTYITTLNPVPNKSWQNALLDDANITALERIICWESGLHIHECDYHAAMTEDPLSMISQGLSRNWSRGMSSEQRTQSPTHYFLFPPPGPSLGKIVALCVKCPDDLTLITDTIFLPIAYRPVFVSYLIYVFNSVDDDYILSQRAAQELQRFIQLLGVAGTNKSVEE